MNSRAYLIATMAMLNFTLLNFASEAQAIDHKDLVGKVVKLPGSDEIYVGAGFTEDNLPIYYAMERIDADNVNKWFPFVRGNDGFLYLEFFRLKKIYDSIVNNTPIPAITIENEFGSNEYFDAIKKVIDVRKDRLKPYFGSMNTINSGFGGILSVLRKSDNKYMVYASRSPITRRFKPKVELPSDTNAATLEKVDEAFRDLIMFMGVVDNEGFPTTTHRGIQKNPIYSVQGIYTNFSLRFHGFAAAVAEKFFRNKKYMLVAPIESMANILQKNVGPQDMYIGLASNCKSQSEITSELKTGEYSPICLTEIGKNLYIGAETPYTIKLEALAKIYAPQ